MWNHNGDLHVRLLSLDDEMTTNKNARTRGLYGYPKKIGPVLAKWYYETKSGQRVLYPTHGSGTLGKNVSSQSGDIAPLSEYHNDRPWVLSVELKHRKDWTWKGFMKDPSTSTIGEYWAQCVEDSLDGEGKLVKYPLLIFTRVYEGTNYAMFFNHLTELKGSTNHILARIDLRKQKLYEKSKKMQKSKVLRTRRQVGILSLEEFTKKVEPRQIIKRFQEN